VTFLLIAESLILFAAFAYWLYGIASTAKESEMFDLANLQAVLTTLNSIRDVLKEIVALQPTIPDSLLSQVKAHDAKLVELAVLLKQPAPPATP
jgi:hypothetical protein